MIRTLCCLVIVAMALAMAPAAFAGKGKGHGHGHHHHPVTRIIEPAITTNTRHTAAIGTRTVRSDGTAAAVSCSKVGDALLGDIVEN